MPWIATALSIGVLLFTQAEEPKQERRVIHLAEMTCKAFTELAKQEQGIIIAWLQGYDLPEGEPAVIDIDNNEDWGGSWSARGRGDPSRP
jgi:hypothetical protein